MYLLAERGGKRTKEEDKSGIGRLERMKLGNGIKVRDDGSNGIEILMSDVFDKINQLTPYDYLNQYHEENAIDPIPPVIY